MSDVIVIDESGTTVSVVEQVNVIETTQDAEITITDDQAVVETENASALIVNFIEQTVVETTNEVVQVIQVADVYNVGGSGNSFFPAGW